MVQLYIFTSAVIIVDMNTEIMKAAHKSLKLTGNETISYHIAQKWFKYCVHSDFSFEIKLGNIWSSIVSYDALMSGSESDIQQKLTEKN